MFKKIDFNKLNYGDLDRLGSHDIKRDELRAFYQTFDFLDLIKKWPQIVGTKLAATTSPLKIKGDSLFIITGHSSFSQELSFSSELIKTAVFKQFPQLKGIINRLAFQTQESFFTQRDQLSKAEAPLTKRLHPQSPHYKILRAQANEVFGHITDDELREMLISLFIQNA
jgi:hypothetical protein